MFVVAGVIFACTAATYAEGTVRHPEAGGSSSFARYAFDELVSFGAAWAQMLVYVVTVATSAFFVPHYLSIFWEPLNSNPWDIVGGAVVIVLLVSLNIVGVQEAAKLSVTLAVVDFGTQVLLVIVGFALVLSPDTLLENVRWGVAPTWSNLAVAVPVAMLAYTGVETVSNLAEEVRDPVRSVPQAYKLIAGAVFAIYLTLPLVALSALPVREIDGQLTTLLALPPEEGGYANDPILGVVENLGLEDAILDGAQIYVGILAATILLIATNAGVIGASRITYSMATHRQLPLAFRRLHPTFKTPWIAILVFSGVAPIAIILPGDVNFIGTLYSFGATLSFTVAHAAIIRLRMLGEESEYAFRARPNLRLAGIEWPLFAILGGIGTGLSFLVILVQNADTRWVGLGWIAAGLIGYAVYRRRWVREPLRVTVRAPAVIGRVTALQYRRLLVPVVDGYESSEAMNLASRLAAERRATIEAVHAIEIPLELPIDAKLPAAEDRANAILDEARAIGDSYGLDVATRVLRGRSAGRAIVDAAARRNSEIVVMGARRQGDGRAAQTSGGPSTSCSGTPLPGDGGGLELVPMTAYRVATAVLAPVLVALGVTMFAVTVVRGGGLGLLLGPLFVALGLGRLYLIRAGTRTDEAARDPSDSDGR